MKNLVATSFLLTVFLCPSVRILAKEIRLASPDSSISATLADGTDGVTTLSLNYNGSVVLPPSQIKLNIDSAPSQNKITGVKKRKTVRETIVSPFYRQKSFDIEYNTAVMRLADGTSLELRVFNDGVAYRFLTSSPDSLIIEDETASYRFPSGSVSWLSYSTNKKHPFAMAFQNIYDVASLDSAQAVPAFLPATVAVGDSVKVTLMESDLEAYPQMFVEAGGHGLKGVFPRYPAEMSVYPWRAQKYVTSTEPFIAKTSGKRTFPWRIFAITDNDVQMPVNNLVYALASPSRVDDISFIKPGKASWEWWNNWGIKNVPFKSGINNETYKYFIDFAADNGLGYVILDEGWYVPSSGDMLTTVPEIDLPELVAYGKDKGVDLILWTVFNVLDNQLEEACSKYKEIGIAGFKVDFLDRADQDGVEMAYRIAEAAARYGLVLDYHGFYTPTGINRTYPNILNYESVFGMEEMKWQPETVDMPKYEVTMPFIRMMAGPLDFTPGAMKNASKKNWKAVYSEPMSQGTRAHHLATYIAFDSPLTMLADAPSNYTDPATLEFLREVPVTVDSTVIVGGKMGEYIVTARKGSNGVWWIGGMTSWEPREVEIDFCFLPEGQFDGYIIRDGANADKIGTDYVKEALVVAKGDKYHVNLASGGGFVMKLIPR